MRFALKEVELMSIINNKKTQSIEYIKKQKKTLLKKNDKNRIKRREKIIEK